MPKDIEKAEAEFGLKVKDSITLKNEVIYIFEDNTAGTLAKGCLPQCRYPNLLSARYNVNRKSLTPNEKAEFKRQGKEVYSLAHNRVG